MPRIAIIDRAEMNPEQARVYDAAQKSGAARWVAPITPISGCPSCSKRRRASAQHAGPPGRSPRASARIVNLAVARHWNAQYPWFAQVRSFASGGHPANGVDAINTRKAPEACPMCGSAPATPWRTTSRQQEAERRHLYGGGKRFGIESAGRGGGNDRQFLDDMHDGGHLRHRAAGRKPDAARAVAHYVLSRARMPVRPIAGSQHRKDCRRLSTSTAAPCGRFLRAP